MKKCFAFATAVCIAGGMALAAFADPYIETDGSQAVNTGYFVKPKTRVEVDYAMLDLQTVQQRIFANVPIRNGYRTTYRGNFFIDTEATSNFLVGDWQDYDAVNF